MNIKHCCVPLRSASSKINSILTFHGFPIHPDLTRQWLVNIRRDNFTITSHTKVCSRHLSTDQLIEPTTLDGRRRLVKGAVPALFEWNGSTVETPRRSVWERAKRPADPVPPEEQHDSTRDHDYCSVPEPSALDMSLTSVEDKDKEIVDLRKELQESRVQREFGLQRFAGSDADIRFYTSTVSPVLLRFSCCAVYRTPGSLTACRCRAVPTSPGARLVEERRHPEGPCWTVFCFFKFPCRPSLLPLPPPLSHSHQGS
ncbi:THAP domain-containing protein 1-like [Lampris incognitus]|uniref:THAP domain-containing protein 1-like n=1 Tax=Lampris incognitus TaxID=2546036 RepID=UPI0024B56E1C|nr:THAP domain-containing protein 1-like [Lampris incognitus]